MRSIRIGKTSSIEFVTTPAHSAAGMGNRGVEAVATSALIVFIEEAAHDCLQDCYETGEASVGTAVGVRHLAPAPIGATVTATARVTAVDGRRVSFDVEARQGDKLLLRGRHERFVVDLDRFLQQQSLVPGRRR